MKNEPVHRWKVTEVVDKAQPLTNPDLVQLAFCHFCHPWCLYFCSSVWMPVGLLIRLSYTLATLCGGTLVQPWNQGQLDKGRVGV